MEVLQKILRILLDLIFPRRAVCMGCGSMLGCDRDDLCEACREKLASSWVGLRPPPKGSRIAGCAYVSWYHGPAGGLVRNVKYRGAWMLAENMGRELGRAAELLRIEDECYVCAVPMHPKRLRVRGRNHAEVLARAAAQRLNLEYVDLLMRTRNAPQQARLSKEERIRNLKGGFALHPEYSELVRGVEILLVDDVFTTGATASCCADALYAAGARRVYFAAYAYGEGKKHGKDHKRKKSAGTAAA